MLIGSEIEVIFDDLTRCQISSSKNTLVGFMKSGLSSS